MRISDWSSDVCSSDLRAFGIEQIERIDRALALLRARDRGGARGLIMRGLERRAAIEIVAVRRQRSLGFAQRSEEHPSEPQSLMRITSAVFCLQKNQTYYHNTIHSK